MSANFSRYAVCFILIGASQGAAAQTSRYTMTPVEQGALRLDTQTGQVSHCVSEYGKWTCKPVEDEAARLKAEIEALKRDKAALEEKAGAAGADQKVQEGQKGEDKGATKIPGDDEIDQMMAFMEKMARRLKDMVEDLRREQAPPPEMDQL